MPVKFHLRLLFLILLYSSPFSPAFNPIYSLVIPAIAQTTTPSQTSWTKTTIITGGLSCPGYGGPCPVWLLVPFTIFTRTEVGDRNTSLVSPTSPRMKVSCHDRRTVMHFCLIWIFKDFMHRRNVRGCFHISLFPVLELCDVSTWLVLQIFILGFFKLKICVCFFVIKTTKDSLYLLSHALSIVRAARRGGHVKRWRSVTRCCRFGTFFLFVCMFLTKSDSTSRKQKFKTFP